MGVTAGKEADFVASTNARAGFGRLTSYSSAMRPIARERERERERESGKSATFTPSRWASFLLCLDEMMKSTVSSKSSRLEKTLLIVVTIIVKKLNSLKHLVRTTVGELHN